MPRLCSHQRLEQAMLRGFARGVAPNAAHQPLVPYRPYQTSVPRIPKPTPFVPDVATFLKLIGRDLSKHSEKITSWNDLFSLTTTQLRDLGVEPSRSRKYLLHWLDRFRHGSYGVGGDARFVGKDGSIEVRLLDVKASPEEAARLGRKVRQATLTSTPGTARAVLNVPSTAHEILEAEDANQAQAAQPEGDADSAEEAPKKPSARPQFPPDWRQPALDKAALRKAIPLQGISYKPGRGICGPFVKLVKGTKNKVATLHPKEGMWEFRRGEKVDGGERRQAEVRSKKRAAERRAGQA